MATTYTGTVGVATSNYWTANTAYAISSDAITLPAGLSKANVVINGGAASNYTGYIKSNSTATAGSCTFYLCNSDATVKVSLGSVSVAINGVSIVNLTKNSAAVSSLAGSRVYICVNPGSASRCYGKFTVKITNVHTAVTAGDKIYSTDRNQTGTATTKGNKITDSHFSSGTKIQASTFNSSVLGL